MLVTVFRIRGSFYSYIIGAAGGIPHMDVTNGIVVVMVTDIVSF